MEAPSRLIPYFNCCAYSSLTEVNMLPITLSYTYAEMTSRNLHGRTEITFTDPADLVLDIPFTEYAKRSSPDISDMYTHIRTHCDEERAAEEMKKAGYTYREVMAIARYFVEEVV
ncbi:hypothetical protein Xsto_04144 [Xenorhabdus stockiae]|uniref:Uncharacterized protein n=1 Tax=Xenorhabdus stockiae TaxID=351614 RepID=A0A2D0K3X5_9GAMM|nr:hypothetical protein [Xenorhabdus stockiae]PHM56697.1 hypothetical protein Xsto_04144 [Xenorhabdus stockiae]